MKTLTHNLIFVFAALFLLSGCASWTQYKGAYQDIKSAISDQKKLKLDAKEIETIVKKYQNHTIASEIKQAGFDDKTAQILETIWFCPTLIREVSIREYKYERGELLRYAKAYDLSHYCQLKHTQLKYYDDEVALLSSISNNYKKYEKNTTAEHKLRSNFNYQEIQALYTKLIKDGSK